MYLWSLKSGNETAAVVKICTPFIIYFDWWQCQETCQIFSGDIQARPWGRTVVSKWFNQFELASKILLKWYKERRIHRMFCHCSRDQLTGLKKLELKKSQKILGLLALASKQLYIVPVYAEQGNNALEFRRPSSLQDGGSLENGELLFCDREIGFM